MSHNYLENSSLLSSLGRSSKNNDKKKKTAEREEEIVQQEIKQPSWQTEISSSFKSSYSSVTRPYSWEYIMHLTKRQLWYLSAFYTQSAVCCLYFMPSLHFYPVCSVHFILTVSDVLQFHAALILVPLSVRPHCDHESTQRGPGTKFREYTKSCGKLSICDIQRLQGPLQAIDFQIQ